MRYARFLIASILALPFGSQLTAETTQCSNAQATVAYYFNSPDGGAPRPPIEYWTIDGQQFVTANCEFGRYMSCPPQSEETVKAFFTEEKPLSFKQFGKPGKGNAHFERIYTVHAKVVLEDESKELANADLICEQTVYNGLPRP